MKHPFFDIEKLGPLYEAVQSAGIFPDSKYFPDCRPKSSPSSILAAYKKAVKQGRLDLKSFVKSHFWPPQEAESHYDSAQKNILDHLNALWPLLTRKADDSEAGSTLIPLPHPYLVPGGRFREVYYWDSYFTLLGVQQSGLNALLRNMVSNFSQLIHSIGFIPNGNRTYYLSRSQPPFFSLMLGLLAEVEGPEIWKEFLPALEKEYRFWMSGQRRCKTDTPAQRRVVRMPDGILLNRYYDDSPRPRPEAYSEDLHLAQASGRSPEAMYRHIRAAAESGWDFSSRWFADGSDFSSIETTDLIAVDLNCLLFHLELRLGEAYAAVNQTGASKRLLQKAKRRKTAILRYCWDEKTGFFYDFHWKKGQTTQRPCLAAAYPLFFGLATPQQADKVAQRLEKDFLMPGGLRTTLMHSGQQWDAPNGWAPLQWLAYKGLVQYGYHELATALQHRWLQNCEKVYAETGKMMEKYNVEDINLKAGGGEYPNQDGFGWTNGVYLRMREEANAQRS